jgi:Tfp pilus assembly protein PilP
MKVGIVVFMLAVLSAAGARAQDRLPLGTHVGSGADARPPGTPATTTYDDQGRRDPFVSLLVTKKSAGPASARPKAGLAGVALADVAVKGIIHNGKSTVALLEGPGGKSFIARNKDLLQDASIKSIDADGVVFVQHVVDAIGTSHARDVRKSLRQIVEADR